MATIRGYIAVSLDGYIASADGSLDWLNKYGDVGGGELSYERFIAGIRTVVMGRETYDAIAGFDVGWPYRGKRAFVVTSRPIDQPVGPVEKWSDGVDALLARLQALDDGDVWVIGGGRLQQAFIERGALDSLALFIAPEIKTGGAGGGTGGIPLFPPNGFARPVKLVSAEALKAGFGSSAVSDGFPVGVTAWSAARSAGSGPQPAAACRSSEGR